MAKTVLIGLMAVVFGISHGEAHQADTAHDTIREVVNATAQGSGAEVDTVYLNKESKPRHIISLERNTRGIKENKGKYGVMALISLVVVAVIGFLIFRSRD